MSKRVGGVWYVRFPTYRYVEDVTAVAKEAGLTIIDARFDDGKGARDVPALTLKPEYRKPEPKPAEPEGDAGEGELVSVFKVVDGLRNERASRANITRDEAEAYIAERSDNVYEIVAE